MTLSTFTAVLLLAYFGFLLATLALRSRPLPGKALFMLRSFFPNWRFYHRVGHQPRLFYRVKTGSGWHDWEMFMPRARRRPWRLLHNADVNVLLANQNLVEHLASDIQDLPEGRHGDDVRELVTFRLVDRLVRHLVRQGPHALTALRYEFMVKLVEPFGDPQTATAILAVPDQEWPWD